MLAEVNNSNVMQIVIINNPTPYTFQTWQKIKIGENNYENHSIVNATLQYLDKNAEGYKAELKIQSITQAAKDAFAELMNDLLPVNNHFIFKISKHGIIEQLLNHAAIIQTWINVKKYLQVKYRDQKEVLAYFEAYELELSNPDSLLQSMKYKGINGSLFPGIYNNSLTTPENSVEKNYFKYFHFCDLPLQYYYKRSEVNDSDTKKSENDKAKYRFLYLNENQLKAESTASLINISGKGNIIEDKFDRKAFTKIIKDITGVSLYKPVIKLTASDYFKLQKETGLIESADQELIVEVAGVYYNSIKSSLKKVNSKD